MAYSQRGLSSGQEQNQKNIIRDTRTLGQKAGDFLRNPLYLIFFLIFLMMFSWILPEFSDFLIPLAVVLFVFCVKQKVRLPFRMPQRSGRKDYNDPHPGTGKPLKARGIYFFGNEKDSQDELWFANEDMRTHVLVFGSTGSGKTEFLVSLAYNALVQSSGFIYVDGKGDNSLFAKVFSMVRSVGREDDLLLINFMTGARDIIGPQEKRLSNTMNPFSMGSSSMLSQLIISLMGGSSSSSDGDMWKGRAISFVEALMKVLVAMRDGGHILLDSNVIRNYFTLDRLEAMVMDKMFIRDGAEPVSLEGLPPTIMEPLTMYVLNLPGYNKDKKGKQVSQVLEQHGFITMQLTRVFTTLADTYGHILRTELAEVDLKDVVLNRRILVVLLPALEKSPDELSNLGKVIIATLKAMMASGLGDSVEGEYRDLIESKPTNANTPFLCILDEYGYYAVEGFAVVPAQARSLGFSVVFAGQDYPAFQKASKEEAASIGANTNIKMCMKLEDPTETWDFFMKTAGESYVAHVESFNAGSNALGSYNDSRGARLEKRARIDLLDLKEQAPGEAHIFFKSTVVRTKVFYAAPKAVKSLRLNHFLKIDVPEDADVEKLVKGFNQYKQIKSVKNPWQEAAEAGPDIVSFVESYADNKSSETLVVKMLATMKGKVKKTTSPLLEELLFGGSKENVGNDINIFLAIRKNSHLEKYLLDGGPEFTKAILNRSFTRDGIEYIQRLCGKASQQATNVAMELLSDMQSRSSYPAVKQEDMPKGSDIAAVIEKLIKEIAVKKAEESEKD